MRLVLFDVDGTLITTAGAGMRAYYRALQSVFKVQVEGNIVRPDGKTDPLIARELLAHFGLSEHWCDAARDALFADYLDFLEEEMCRAKDYGTVGILPGVISLLDRLSIEPDFAVGVVTGNIEKGARIKLQKVGLDKYFRYGGYGSDSEDRTHLTKIGIQRGSQLIAPAEVTGIFVVGDTPLDVVHGRAAGAYVIAVASAGYSLDELRSYDPDLALSDLTDTDSIISFMRTLECNKPK